MAVDSGIIIIDKPIGYTSRDIVNIVSKYTHIKKVGHTGTLDPLASGVLVIAYGKALKLVDDITSDYKEYVVEAIIGTLTDTLDMEGNVTNTSNTVITNEMVQKVIDDFPRKYLQEVPLYSAVKVNGRRLYDYARSGVNVNLPKREVCIRSIELLSDVTKEENNYLFSFKCVVSKGFYIRSLVRDIGDSLNSFGTVKSLRRTRQGDFLIEDANNIDDIKNLSYRVIPIRDVLDIPRVTLYEEELFKVKNGATVKKFFDGNRVLVLDNDGREVAIYEEYNVNYAKCYKMF